MSQSLNKSLTTSPFSLHLIYTISYAIFAVFSLGYFIFFKPETYIIVGITLLLMILPAFFTKTEYGVLVLIIIRPIIDTYSNYTIISSDFITLNMNSVLGIAVAAWGLLVILKEQINLKKIPGFWWLLAFLGVCFITIAVSSNLTTTVGEIIRLASIYVFYIIGWHLVKKDHHYIVWLINAVALSAVVPILVGLYQLVTFGGISADGISNRIYGTFGHPNVLGFYMVLVITVVLIKYLSAPFHHRSLIYPWIIAGGFTALLFTYTRGAWIGLAIVLLVLGIARYRKALFTVIISFLLIYVFAAGINTLMISSFNISLYDIPIVNRIFERNEESDSIQWRLDVFNQMAPKTLESPLIGHGLGSFVNLRQQGDIGLFDDPEAHNDYLRLAVEIGFVGLFIYIMLAISFFRQAVLNYALILKNCWRRDYTIALIALLAAFYAMSVSDNILQGTAVMWTLMFVVGGFLALGKR